MFRWRSDRYEPVSAAALVVAALLSAAAGLVVGQIVAASGQPASAPVTVVSSVVVDRVPGWLKDLAISWFGTADKLVLQGCVLLVVALVTAALALALRRFTAIALVLLAAVPAALSSARDGLGERPWLPSLAAGVVAALLFLFLYRVAEQQGASPTDRPRRRFLLASGLVGVFAVLGAGLGRSLGGARDAALARARRAVPQPRRPAPAAPAGVDPVAGITPYQTPNPDFYRIDTALSVPQLDADTWRLRVVGEVAEELTLSYVDLVDEGLVEAWVTLTCVSNEVGGGLAGNARWAGVPVRDVLARARPAPGADMVLSRSSDGWTASTPLTALTDDRQALLALTMNGQLLPPEHGYPVRLVVPGLYGYVSATKWVTELRVTRFSAATAYWTQRGWAARGPIKVASRIDVPAAGASVAAGEVAVAGVAWAQHLGVSKVEVRVGDGPFEPAQLAPTIGPDTWVQWVYRWAARPGRHRLTVRATDANGMVQTAMVAPPAPDGATGLHTIEVEVS